MKVILFLLLMFVSVFAAVCPKCGEELTKGRKGYFCENCGSRFSFKEIDSVGKDTKKTESEKSNWVVESSGEKSDSTTENHGIAKKEDKKSLVLKPYQINANSSIFFVNMNDSLIKAIDSLKTLKETYKKSIIDTMSDKVKIPKFFSATLEGNLDTFDVVIDNKVEYKKVLFPINIKNIPVGFHKIFVKNMYGSVDYREFLAKKDTNYTLKFDAPIPTCKINITSSPQMSVVYLNGSKLGLSPVTVKNIKPGKYNIKIEKVGYLTFETSLELNGRFDPKVVASLVPDIPHVDNAPMYAQPKKVVGMSFGAVALVSTVLGIVYRTSASSVDKEGDDYKAKYNDALLKGLDQKDYHAKSLDDYKSADNKRNFGNIMLMVGFITAGVSVPLIVF